MRKLSVFFIGLYFLWLFFLLPILFTQKTQSPFYFKDDLRNRRIERLKFKNRQVSAELYLASVNQYENKEYYENLLKSKNLVHLIVILAERPANQSVLLQLASYIDQSVKKSAKDTHAMVLYKGSKERNEELASLSKYYPVISSSNLAYEGHEENICSNFLGALNYSTNMNATYITIIRDNVLPYENFLSNLFYIMDTKLISGLDKDGPENKSKWLFMHLHEPYYLRHFSFAADSIQELMIVGLTGFILYFAISKCILQVSNYNITFGIYGSVIFITLCLCVGRPYLTEIRRHFRYLFRLYVFDEAIPVTAISLPLANARLMYSYLNSLKCSKYFPFMKMWDNAITYFGIPAYIVSPSLVRYAVNS